MTEVEFHTYEDAAEMERSMVKSSIKGANAIKEWSRKERGDQSLFYLGRVAPHWEAVTRRVTRDIDTGKVIGDDVVTDNNRDDKSRWHRPLPKGVSNIETTLY